MEGNFYVAVQIVKQHGVPSFKLKPALFMFPCPADMIGLRFEYRIFPVGKTRPYHFEFILFPIKKRTVRHASIALHFDFLLNLLIFPIYGNNAIF